MRKTKSPPSSTKTAIGKNAISPVIEFPDITVGLTTYTFNKKEYVMVNPKEYVSINSEAKDE